MLFRKRSINSKFRKFRRTSKKGKSKKFLPRFMKLFKGGNFDLKTELEKFLKHNTQDFFVSMRKKLRELGGLPAVKQWLRSTPWKPNGDITFAEKDSDMLKYNGLLNVFIVKAMEGKFIINGINILALSHKEKEHQKYLDNSQDKYLLSFNRPEADAGWETGISTDNTKNEIGSASMSKYHRLLTIKDPTIRLFNVLTFGMSDDDVNQQDVLKQDLELLNEMRDVALTYVKNARNNNEWGDDDKTDVGLYFHCFPLNSVQSLHLHIVDLNNKGPAFDKHEHKNLPIDVVISVLNDELNNATQQHSQPSQLPNSDFNSQESSTKYNEPPSYRPAPQLPSGGKRKRRRRTRRRKRH